MDSDDDGYGDLKGITSKLKYLQSIGVTAVWLSPIFKSPDNDMGYDISDYKDIQPRYGTLEDFDEMVEEAHSLGLKVILDFVPNHSSDEHRWFQEALKGPDNPYHYYYMWNEGIPDSNGDIQPPNNWGSVFHDNEPGTAWQWVPDLKKYYYRTFHQGQPDLNYTNPIVVHEMKTVFRFWARKGVDGFRIDAIPYLFEDRLLRDNNWNDRTENLPETYDMVRQWRQVFDEEGERLGKDLVMMLEAYADVPQTMKYYGSKDFPAGHFPFNFQIISNIKGESTAAQYVEQINAWIDNKPDFGWSNWVVGNHDNHRVGSRLGEKNIDGINMMVMLLPGTAITYYGEELGMLDHPELKLENCRDPQACPSGATETYYQEHSRDFERTPMQWDKTANAGFTKGDPWLPVPANYETLNVASEEDDKNSHLNIYKKLAELRKELVVQTGKLEVKAEGNVLSFLRQNDTYSLLVLINLKETAATFDVTTPYGYIGDLQQLLASAEFTDQTINLQSVNLKGNTAVVLGGPRYKWWQTGIVYQIYPRSFKDSDDNGLGDLKGITSKLKYIKDIGVSTVWLSPIYASEDLDLGYDISNFIDIHKDYGNMKDFEDLVEEAHNLGLKVVLDFVPNHSSDKHEWFIKAKQGDKDYFDYYVWEDSKEEDNPIPPNNWQSVFDNSKPGTAWTYDEDVKKFYLHQFLPEQPDLNFRNEKVKEEIEEVLKFWLEKGVDGFRVDAVTHLFEDKDLMEAENPKDSNQYLMNLPETYELVKEWRKLLDEEGKKRKKDLVLMLEASAGGEQLSEYFGSAEKPGGHFPFNFMLINDLPDLSIVGNRAEAKRVKEIVENWISLVPKHGWSNWVLGNHDNHRVGSRVGDELVDAFNMLVTLLPGTAVTYNGEEIGMLDNRELTIDDCKDTMACPKDFDETDETAEEYYARKTRDFERSPMQWNNELHAGFCDTEDCDPWIPLPSDYKTTATNVRSEEDKRRSHLFNYKKLAALRSEPAIQSGKLSIDVLDDNVLCISRKNDSYAYLVIINFDDKDNTVNIYDVQDENNKKIHEDIGSVKETVSFNFASSDVDASAVPLGKYTSVVLEGALRKKSTEPEELKWWQTGIIYQIYPRSFQDTDGDGIGDLPGITARLEYLRDLGVTAVWLSPIFSSPDWDMGYDISDFENISELFGTLGDFDELIQEAHRLGLKVLLDFVPNHTSDEHRWFQRAVTEGPSSEYYKYYVWHPGKGAEKPNNWEGAFTTGTPGSAWSKYEVDGVETDEYYLHQFHAKQPDLDYRNPAVVEAMKGVLRFWVRRGVDGFRVDAIQHLVEDADFKDNDEDKDRDKQMNQPLTYEIIQQWKDVLDREGALLQKDLALFLEVYTDVDPLMKYFGSELRPAGDFPFNFFLISELRNHNLNADTIISLIKKFEDNKPDFGWSNWVMGNHDQFRVASRLERSELIDGINMLVTLLPGTAITYNGEEIGMLNNDDLEVKDCKDPMACPEGDETSDTYYQEKTRDRQRTPIQWDNTTNAGFTSGTPWLPVNKNYLTLNVKFQEMDPGSHLNVYKKLAGLRKELAIQRGDFHMEKLGTNVFSFSRRNVSHAYVVLINLNSVAETIEVKKSDAYLDLPKMLKYVSSSNFEVEEGAEVDLDSLRLPAYASVVLTSEPVVDNDDFGDEIIITTPGAASATSPLGLLLAALLAITWFLRT